MVAFNQVRTTNPPNLISRKFFWPYGITTTVPFLINRHLPDLGNHALSHVLPSSMFIRIEHKLKNNYYLRNFLKKVVTCYTKIQYEESQNVYFLT